VLTTFEQLDIGDYLKGNNELATIVSTLLTVADVLDSSARLSNNSTKQNQNRHLGEIAGKPIGAQNTAFARMRSIGNRVKGDRECLDHPSKNMKIVLKRQRECYAGPDARRGQHRGMFPRFQVGTNFRRGVA